MQTQLEWLTTLNQQYQQLLNSTLAISLFLQLTEKDFHDQIEMSALIEIQQFSLMRYLPNIVTTVEKIFNKADRSGVQFFCTVPKAFAANCSFDNQSPLRDVRFAQRIHNQARTQFAMMLEVPEVIKAIRDECVRALAENVQSCLRHIEQIDHSSLQNELSAIREQFSHLLETLNDRDDVFETFRGELSALLEEHYRDLHQALIAWQSAYENIAGRTELFRLHSCVVFLSNIFNDNSLVPFAGLGEEISYEVLNARRQLEYKWQFLSIDLTTKVSDERVELKDRYTEDVNEVLENSADILRNLINSCRPDIDSIPALSDHYELMRMRSCYLRICNRDHTSPTKRRLFNDGADPADTAHLSDQLRIYSPSEVNFISAGIKLLEIVFGYTQVNLTTLITIAGELPFDYLAELAESYSPRIGYIFQELRLLEQDLVAIEICVENPALIQLKQVLLTALLDKQNRCKQYLSDFTHCIANHHPEFHRLIVRECKKTAELHRQYEIDYAKYFRGKLLDKCQHYISAVNNLSLLKNQLSSIDKYFAVMEDKALTHLRSQLFQSLAVLDAQQQQSIEAVQQAALIWYESVQAAMHAQPLSMAVLIHYYDLLRSLQLIQPSLIAQIESIIDLEIKQRCQLFLQNVTSISEEQIQQRISQLVNCPLIEAYYRQITQEHESIATVVRTIPSAFGYLLRCISVLEGGKDVQLSQEVYTIFTTVDNLVNRLTQQKNAMSQMGDSFMQIIFNSDKWRRIIHVSELFLENLQSLRNNYMDINELVKGLDHPVDRAALEELKRYTAEIGIVLNQSKEMLNNIMVEIKQNYKLPDNSINDIIVMLKNLSIEDDHSHVLSRWINNLELSVTKMQSLKRRLVDYCEKIKIKSDDFEETLSPTLDDVVLKTFAQICVKLDSTIKMHLSYGELMRRKMQQMLSIAPEVKTHSFNISH